MPYDMYQVDAFTKHAFAGNPAAVLILDAPWDVTRMQALAAENNLSETAFIVPRNTDGHYDLRWFTPTDEIDFCGHATLASAHVLCAHINALQPLHFHTQIGVLKVSERHGLYTLDAPSAPAHHVAISQDMHAAINDTGGTRIKVAFEAGGNLHLVLGHADDVRECVPSMEHIALINPNGVGITAKGDGQTNPDGVAYDCVSRFFVPNQGIEEDPVTGSAHAAIGPYWAAKLNKSDLLAYQASKRGGQLYISVTDNDRVHISGHAVTIFKAELYV